MGNNDTTPARPSSSGPAVMTIVRDLAESEASAADIARKTGFSEARISEARAVLRHASDLVEEVIAGRMGLTRAYRTAMSRRAGAVDLNTVRHLTVAEMARLLHVVPETVYKAIRRGELEASPDKYPVRIPAAAARDYLIKLGYTNDCGDLLPPGEAAAKSGKRTGTLARAAGRGQLRAIRTPGGHRRYQAPSPDGCAGVLPLTHAPIRA